MDGINTTTLILPENSMLYETLSKLKEFKTEISRFFVETIADGNRFPPIFESFFTDIEQFLWSDPDQASTAEFGAILNIYAGSIKLFLCRHMIHGTSYAAMIDMMVNDAVSAK